MLEVVVSDVMDALIPAVVFVSIAALMDVWVNAPVVENRVAPSAADVLEIAAHLAVYIAVRLAMMTVRMDADIHACLFVLQHVSALAQINALAVRQLAHRTVCISAQDLIPEFRNRFL